MIKSIKVDNASYRAQPQDFGPLGKINIVYGPNGSGKTTISRAAGQPHQTAIDWKHDDSQKVYVYNRDFVSGNFRESEDFQGVFTLGEENIETEQRLLELSGDISSKREKRAKSQELRKEKEKEVRDRQIKLENKLWKAKSELQESLPEAFQGLNNAKTKFRERCLVEFASKDLAGTPLQQLKREWSAAFGENPKALSQLPTPQIDKLNSIAESELWTTAIVGSSDVDLSKLIEVLENIDWVRRGLDYLNESEGICPMCQQPVPDDLNAKLAAIFDSQFESKRKELIGLKRRYDEHAEHLYKFLTDLEEIEAESLIEIEMSELRLATTSVRSVILENQSRMQTKLQNLATSKGLESSTHVETKLLEVVGRENNARSSHNDAIADLENTKARLGREAWKALFDPIIAAACDDYLEWIEPAQKGIDGLKSTAENYSREIDEFKKETRQLELRRTSVVPTANWINAMLVSAGFDGFKIAVVDDRKRYRIERPNKNNALRNLSEGEKSLVTFLYFYNLASGSNNSQGITEKRILVIDDPVSSLDSQSLFIVSTLVRELADKANDQRDKISQLILLTHNIKFHHEVTFGAKSRKWKDISYWTVRKDEYGSKLKRHVSNPVASSYELAWKEAMMPDESARKVTVRNAMRRILESYFKLIGETSPVDHLPEVDPHEKIVMQSLISWVHAGSHAINDDLYSSDDSSTVDTYRRVFRSIFEESGHSAHFELMMRTIGKDPG